MADPAYPAARAVSARVLAHLAHHRRVAEDQGWQNLAPMADAASLEAVIDAAFWASLRHEEGQTPKISIAYVPASSAAEPLTFESWLPLTPASLAKLAPAVERPGIHLGVWRDEQGDLGIWGTTRRPPPLSFVLEVVASGLLVIKHRGDSFGKFVNVAVLEGDEVKIVKTSDARSPDCPGVLASLLGVNAPGVAADSTNVLVELSASMRAHGRGGALLIVPADSRSWLDSIVTPILYAVAPQFSGLSALVRDRVPAHRGHEWREDLRRTIDWLAGLTAVDGATIMSDRYELLAFGAKITRRHDRAAVERVLLTEPVEGAATRILNPYQLGGTRHLSAAQFVHDQRDATALVASQDGKFTIFIWSPNEEIVHAHRVEALLL